MVKKEIITLVILALISAVLFIVTNNFFSGNLESPQTLRMELKTDLEELYEWKISEEPPFKYRVLFPFIVNQIAFLISDGKTVGTFFSVYYFVSMFFYITTALTFYWFLYALRFDYNWRIVGLLILITLPAYALAFTLPVHTREDMMAYTFLNIGLIAILKNRHILFLIAALLGILTRETLLILPFVYFFFSRGTLLIRFSIALLSFLLFIYIRYAGGIESYDLWLGLRWNLDNIQQVIGFGYISFHILWILFFISMFRKKATFEMKVIKNSSPFILILVLSTTFLFGIFNEIRLLFLIFPWVISMSLHEFKTNEKRILETLKTKLVLIYDIVIILVLIITLPFIVENYDRVLPPSKYLIPYETWIYAASFYICISLCFMPIIKTIILNFDKTSTPG